VGVRVLVTGHEGYIGAVMMTVLRDAGHDVAGLDTGFYREGVLGEPAPASARIPVDLRQVERHDVEGFDAVVHLAALSNDPLGDLDPRLTLEINHAGSLRLARLAKDAGVRRFLFASSCSMYGAGAGDVLLDEDAPFNPITPYAESKIRLEADLRRLASADFSPVYLRNATAYGVSPHLRLDIVLNNLVGWAATTGQVRLMSDGKAWRPMVHVEDICRVFAEVLAAPAEAVHDRAFNVGQVGENHQIRALAGIVRDTVPGCEITFGDAATADPRNYRVDFTRLAMAFPDFTFKWTASTGARELYEAYRAAGLTESELTGRRFIRLNQLRHLMASGRLDADLYWRASTEGRTVRFARGATDRG
jgi:nucleoside-diphosphate-sugar epimerase